MRIIIFFFCITMLSPTQTTAKYTSLDSIKNYIGTKLCKVESIKRQKDVFILNVKCDSIHYKVVSVKERSDYGEKIQVGNFYKLALFSYNDKSNIFNSFMNFEVTKNNFVLANEMTKELYYSTNLKGLYYSNSFSLQVHDSIYTGLFRINKIQKKEHYYRIIIRNEKQQLILISMVCDSCKCNAIKEGESYELELVSYFREIPWQERFPIMNIIIEDVDIENDVATRDLFFTRNLKGLCYLKK